MDSQWTPTKIMVESAWEMDVREGRSLGLVTESWKSSSLVCARWRLGGCGWQARLGCSCGLAQMGRSLLSTSEGAGLGIMALGRIEETRRFGLDLILVMVLF